MENFLNLRDQNLDFKNIRSMLKCHTQVVQVHLQPFWYNLLLKCVTQQEIAKNSLKTPILGFKIIQGHCS